VFALLDGYDASIHEVHHIHKKDAPSGTALTLKSQLVLGGWSHPVAVSHERTSDVVGLHTLAWNSVHDAVVLQHEAKSRQGFAEGAVLALRWTWSKHLANDHGVYTMTDLF
jgi:4-hydroxy-tetrahydrodipicolinate reductase